MKKLAIGIKDQICSFIGYYIQELGKIEWYDKLIILLFFLRSINIPYGNDVIPQLQEYGYTYQEFWYYFSSRLLEVCFIWSIFKKTSHNIVFLSFLFLGIGAVVKEFTSNAFSWNTEQFIWLFLVFLYTYVFHVLTEKRLDKNEKQLTMDNKSLFDFWWSDVWAVMLKHMSIIGLLLLGLVGKFSYDFLQNKKFTVGYILANSGISIFGGWLASGLIDRFSPDNRNLLIPIATMLAYNLVSALMSINWEAVANREWRKAFDILLKKKD
jgi:hypothetical protein